MGGGGGRGVRLLPWGHQTLRRNVGKNVEPVTLPGSNIRGEITNSNLLRWILHETYPTLAALLAKKRLLRQPASSPTRFFANLTPSQPPVGELSIESFDERPNSETYTLIAVQLQHVAVWRTFFHELAKCWLSLFSALTCPIKTAKKNWRSSHFSFPRSTFLFWLICVPPGWCVYTFFACTYAYSLIIYSQSAYGGSWLGT